MCWQKLSLMKIIQDYGHHTNPKKSVVHKLEELKRCKTSLKWMLSSHLYTDPDCLLQHLRLTAVGFSVPALEKKIVMYINRELLAKFLTTVAGLGSALLWRLDIHFVFTCILLRLVLMSRSNGICRGLRCKTSLSKQNIDICIQAVLVMQVDRIFRLN